jgi:hypothetical protein
MPVNDQRERMTRFGATWDRSLRLTTWLVGLFLAGLAGALLALSLIVPALLPAALLASAIMAAVVGVTWLLAPIGYELRPRALVVLRRVRPISVALEEIRGVDRLADGAAGWALRVSGNAGMFGWVGEFWNRRLGLFRVYATRRTGLVRVDTERELFVLSPDDPDAFVAAVLERAHAARRGAVPAPGRQRRARVHLLRILGAIAAVVLVLPGGLFAALHGFAPIAASVEGDAIRVERRWAGPVVIPLRTVRSAALLPPQRGKRWWRTAGTDLGDVRYGRFASRELGDFQLYAWRRDQYVLVETDGGRLVLTPDDPEQFVEEVRRGLGER